YQAKRSFEPIILSITEDENDILFYVVNDLPQYERGMIRLELLDFESNIPVRQEYHSNVNNLSTKDIKVFEIKGTYSSLLCRIPKKTFEKFNKSKVVLKASLFGKEKVHTAFFYFVKPKDLTLIKPDIAVYILYDHTVILQSEVLAKFVLLISGNGFIVV